MSRVRVALAGLIVAASLAALPGHAGEAAPAAADPQLELRVQALAAELRCLVCQNQTIADSNAPLAVDLRDQIRVQLKSGKSERDVVDFMVARYGDFVLYRPPLNAATLMLWAGPFVLAVLGIVILMRRLVRRRADAPAPLTAAEHERAAALLGGREGGER